MGDDRPPFFRVVGVSRAGKSISDYAAELEDVMNGLMDDGYVVHTQEDPEGTLIHGELDVEAMSEASAQSVEPPAAQPKASERTLLLLQAFDHATNLRVCDVAKNKHLTRDYSVEELKEAATYAELAAKAHAPHNGCDIGQFLEAVAKVLKQVANENLQ